MVVLGIDPGSANTGYGVVELRGTRLLALDGGVIKTNGPLEERLVHIHARVAELIAEHAPVALAVEELYFGANARSAASFARRRRPGTRTWRPRGSARCRGRSRTDRAWPPPNGRT